MWVDSCPGERTHFLPFYLHAFIHPFPAVRCRGTKVGCSWHAGRPSAATPILCCGEPLVQRPCLPRASCFRRAPPWLAEMRACACFLAGASHFGETGVGGAPTPPLIHAHPIPPRNTASRAPPQPVRRPVLCQGPARGPWNEPHRYGLRFACAGGKRRGLGLRSGAGCEHRPRFAGSCRRDSSRREAHAESGGRCIG